MRLLDSVLATLKVSLPLRRVLREVLMLLLIVPGRATFRNLSRYSGYDEKTVVSLSLRDELSDFSDRLAFSMEFTVPSRMVSVDWETLYSSVSAKIESIVFAGRVPGVQ